MRHKSYQTAQRYINYARQMDAAVAGLHVPEVLRRAEGQGYLGRQFSPGSPCLGTPCLAICPPLGTLK